jgi:hypothetical protein
MSIEELGKPTIREIDKQMAKLERERDAALSEAQDGRNGWRTKALALLRERDEARAKLAEAQELWEKAWAEGGTVQLLMNERDTARAYLKECEASLVNATESNTENLRESQRWQALAAMLREALAKYEALDEQIAKCTDEDNEGGHDCTKAPEACEYCFPFADDARLAMRAALAATPADALAELCGKRT